MKCGIWQKQCIARELYMKLRIQNFAKIKEADIILDGITVIAGNNNTGKSTVGKILDSMYNATNNLEDKMKNAKKSRLRNTLRSMSYVGSLLHLPSRIVSETVEQILEAESQEDELFLLQTFLKYVLPDNQEMEDEAALKETIEQIDAIKAIPDEVFTRVILSNYFGEMFNGNINNAEEANGIALVEIHIKNGKNTIQFCNDVCLNFSFDYNPVSSSVYLDNPMLLDKLNNTDVMRIPRRYLSEQEYNLYTKLAGERSSAEERAMNEIINMEKLDEVMRLLNKVIPGEITYNRKYEYRTEKGKTK